MGKLISLLNISGKSIDNTLTQNYQPLEYENPSTVPKFISRGQSYRAVIGDTIILPCATQDLGEKRRRKTNNLVLYKFHFNQPSIVCAFMIISFHTLL